MISVAVQDGNWVHVYDEKNRRIGAQAGELQGYTSTTFSVKQGNWIHTYDEHGHRVSGHPSN